MVALAFALLPVYWMLVMAVQRTADLYAWPPRLIPNVQEIGVFARLFATQPIGRWLANSVVVGSGAAALAVAASVFGAYSLSRFRYRGRGTAGFLLLLTQMLPTAVLIVPLFVLFNGVGLLDSRLGLILANAAITAPITVWLLKAFFDAIPTEIEEAALVDGAHASGSCVASPCRCRRLRW